MVQEQLYCLTRAFQLLALTRVILKHLNKKNMDQKKTQKHCKNRPASVLENTASSSHYCCSFSLTGLNESVSIFDFMCKRS